MPAMSAAALLKIYVSFVATFATMTYGLYTFWSYFTFINAKQSLSDNSAVMLLSMLFIAFPVSLAVTECVHASLNYPAHNK